jgi:hypothetical protein
VSVQFDTTRQAYCILASNTASGKGSHDWTYVSDKGGLQPASVQTCAASGTYATN